MYYILLMVASILINSCAITVEFPQAKPKQRFSFDCKEYNPYYVDCPYKEE